MAKINQTSNTVSLGKGRCQISEEQKRQLWQKVPQCQHSCSKTARLKVVKKKKMGRPYLSFLLYSSSETNSPGNSGISVDPHSGDN